jgi:hypothetical protein
VSIDLLESQINRERQRVSELVDAHPDWSNRRISSYVWPRAKGRMDFWVEAHRHFKAGTIPPLETHVQIVRWCYEVGELSGWTIRTESSIRLAPRSRMIPDVLVRRKWNGPVSLVVEVKRTVDSTSDLTKAIRQVSRYVDWFAVRSEHDGVRGVILAKRFEAKNAVERIESAGLLMWTPDEYLAYLKATA